MTAYCKATKNPLTALTRWATSFCAILIFGFPGISDAAFEILIGTGPTGTFSHFSGRVIERVIHRQAPGLMCRSIASQDVIDNLTNLKQGYLDLALADARLVYDAVHKKNYFEFLDIAYDSLRVLLPMFSVPITLVVRDNAQIDTLDDLHGKRINAGAPRSLRHLVTRTLMKTKGWSPSDFGLITEISSSLSQDSMAFCYGTIQAMVHMGVHPDTGLEQLIERCQGRLVGINDRDIEGLVADDPVFAMSVIAENTYPQQTAPVQTLSVFTLLIASEDMDEQTAYGIIETLYKNKRTLQTAHPSMLAVDEDVIRKGIAGIEMHPGAVRFFKEN
jgi:TRAP transporter TAXI family solute receptor